MLSPNQLQTFFRDNNIPLQGKAECSKSQLLSLYLKASKHGYGLVAFLDVCVLTPEKNGITTNFDNANELYDAYLCFTVGRGGIKC